MKTPVQKFCAAALVAAALTAGAVGVNAQTTNALSISNNSFETPQISSGTANSYQPGAGTSGYMSGWTTTSAGSYVTLENKNPAITGQNGNQFLEIFQHPAVGTGVVNIYQSLSNNFIAGDIYTLTAWAGADSTQFSAATNSFFYLGTSSSSFLSSTVIPGGTVGSNTLLQYTVTYTASTNDAGQPIFIGFNEPLQTGATNGGGPHTYMAIDNFTITQTTSPVPEPAGVALAAVGGLALVLAYRRRRSA